MTAALVLLLAEGGAILLDAAVRTGQGARQALLRGDRCMAQGDGDSRGTQVRSAWAGQVGVVVMRRRGAEKRGLFRLVDESGEDYLYPKDLFAVVDLPSAVTRKLAVAT